MEMKMENKSYFTQQFEEFGVKMYVLGIFSIISIFSGGIIQLAMLIVMVLALKHLKEANLELRDKRLEKLRTNIIYAIIIAIIGIVALIVSEVIVVVFFVQSIPMPLSSPITAAEFQLMAPWVPTLLLVALIFIPFGAVALGLLSFAMNNLYMFFDKNSGLFPQYIVDDAKEGAKNIKKAFLILLISLIGGGVMIIIAVVIFPQIEVLVSYAVANTIPPVYSIAGVIAALTIPGIAMAILSVGSFILMTLGYFNLSHLKNL